MKFAAFLTIITTVVSSCAAPVALSTPSLSSSQPLSTDNDIYRLIDPAKPPTDGLYLTWDDARRLLLQQNRDALEHQIALIEKDRDIALIAAQADKSEAVAKEAIEEIGSPFRVYGLWIGMGIGALTATIFAVALSLVSGGK